MKAIGGPDTGDLPIRLDEGGAMGKYLLFFCKTMGDMGIEEHREQYKMKNDSDIRERRSLLCSNRNKIRLLPFIA